MNLHAERWSALDFWLLGESAGEKLPPSTRAAALMALACIVLIGMLIIAAILVGGHWVRRQGDFRRGPSVPPDHLPLASQAAAAHTAKGRRPAHTADSAGDGLENHDDASDH